MPVSLCHFLVCPLLFVSVDLSLGTDHFLCQPITHFAAINIAFIGRMMVLHGYLPAPFTRSGGNEPISSKCTLTRARGLSPSLRRD